MSELTRFNTSISVLILSFTDIDIDLSEVISSVMRFFWISEIIGKSLVNELLKN